MQEAKHPSTQPWDTIVVGAGVGGLAAAARLATAGQRVLVLEANYLPGGCCSSYWRKGRIFESGATTLVGFGPGQPLHLLQQLTGFELDAQPLDPPMTVWLDGQEIPRPSSQATWLATAQQAFGQPEAQARFWRRIFQLDAFVWKASARNLRFPPANLPDWLNLAWVNPPTDLPKLRFAFRSVASELKRLGLAGNTAFRRFLDEQLLITAQATCEHVPLLFAAPALAYTNSRNDYLPGGMIQLPFSLMAVVGRHGGDVRLRTEVTALEQTHDGWQLTDQQGHRYQAHQVVSNLPLWNLPGLMQEAAPKHWTQKEAQALTEPWGAFTMSMAIADGLPADLSLHHQIHLPEGETLPHTGSRSIFISLSHPEDRLRAPAGERALALSTHAADPASWNQLDKATYDARKEEVRAAILSMLEAHWPPFRHMKIVYQTESTPRSWIQWTRRWQGAVGGVPQRMGRPVFTWPGAVTPFKGLYLCGDTVYPGQGVPGVALGGLIAAERVLRA